MISVRDLQKPAWEFKNVNSILMTKYVVTYIEISTKDILTVPIPEPTGVEVADLQVTQGVPQDTNADIDFGLVHEPPDIIPHERETTRRPTGEPTAAALPQDPAPPRQGMAARNVRVRTPP